MISVRTFWQPIVNGIFKQNKDICTCIVIFGIKIEPCFVVSDGQIEREEREAEAMEDYPDPDRPGGSRTRTGLN